MQNTTRRKKRQYEAELPVSKYLGRNSWGSHSALRLEESREISNWDIFSQEGEDDYLLTRRGSRFLRPEDVPTKRGSSTVFNAITWDIGDEVYLITQEGTSFYSQSLIEPGNPVLIAAVGGGAFALSTEEQAGLTISGDKLYVFHPGGNKIIEWYSADATFKGFAAGLTYPFIAAVTSANSGVISGSYTLGIEKVYQVSGSDRMASTPNRKTTAGILAVSGTVSAKKIKVTVQSGELDTDPLWTHLRFYRSKNKNIDATDPANPIDAQGLDNELYEEALITRAEMGAAALASIATSSSLPLGNAGTQAGKPAGVYTIEVNNLDTVLFDLVEIDQIELVPLPPARTGCFHAKRIFVSNVNDAALDDRSQNSLFYSSLAGTKYGCQHNPLNFIDTGRDGEVVKKLLSFEKDLIAIKEGRTGRLPGGNVDLAFEVLDPAIGIEDMNLATFLPGIGIVAITNDHRDFRIFGYDLRWSATLNGLDIASPIRNEALEFDASLVSFLYINGKVLVSDGTGVFYALHAQEKRGWTRYAYPMNGQAGRAFTFQNGRRAAVASPLTYLMEIEVDGLTTDDSTADDSLENAITASETTSRWQSGKGAHILEHDYLAVEASLSQVMTGVPYCNGVPWPLQSAETETDLTPDPGLYVSGSGLQDREYRMYITPSTVGTVQWGRLVGNYLHYVLSTEAPAVQRAKTLFCDIDEDGMSFGSFDPFQSFGAEAAIPESVQSLIDGGYEDETVTDEIDGGYEDETVSDSIDGGYSA